MKLISIKFILKPALMVILTVITLQAQTMVEVYPVKDNTLIEDSTGSKSNGKGEHFHVGRTNQAMNSIRRGLISFELGDIPQGSTIDSVSLKLNMSQSQAGPQEIHIHSVMTDWGEAGSVATGGQGATADTGDATWVHTFYDSVFWSVSGGDFNETISASQTVDDSGSYTWESTELMVADVQSWLDNPAANFGWILMGGEDSAQTVKRFDSKDNLVEVGRPVLTVNYSLPTTIDRIRFNPESFYLAQNYPNPFNPLTNITFNLPYASKTRLEVYDVLGQLVFTIFDGYKTAGAHEVGFDATNLTSGIYFYHLTADRFSEVRMMTVMK